MVLRIALRTEHKIFYFRYRNKKNDHKVRFMSGNKTFKIRTGQPDDMAVRVGYAGFKKRDLECGFISLTHYLSPEEKEGREEG